MNQPSYVVLRKNSFLSSAATGFSAIVVTLLLTTTTVFLYTVHVASDKSERVIALAQSAIKGLPEFRQALPPAVADMLDDQRRPDYCKELTISARIAAPPDSHGRVRTTVEIVNNGSEVVSLLSLRLLILDAQDQLLCESQEWAATPLAADNGWRGPIMPGARRQFISYRACRPSASVADLRTEVEITELRVWNNPTDRKQAQPATASSARADGPAERG
jgi:hypothetical protein